MLTVIEPGALCTVQDDGRPGFAAVGVGRSGSADQVSFSLANRLLGNAPGAAALELTLGGCALRADDAVTIAVTGAPCPMLVDGRSVDPNRAHLLGAGSVLEIGTPTTGLRSYLAVRGGISVPPVLGSRSYDQLADLGPPPVRAGDRLPVGPHPARALPAADVVPLLDVPESPTLQVFPGPRVGVLGPDSFDRLLASEYTLTPACDRVALRLSGPPPVAAGPGGAARLAASEGMVTGAIQIPPDGQPVLFLADHPVSGGYPVLAVVAAADIALAAQLRPGQRMQFAAAPQGPLRMQ
jgi:biotin-dependent carboxylase-like uncharacterized protein